jgi:hypothetical protein
LPLYHLLEERPSSPQYALGEDQSRKAGPFQAVAQHVAAKRKRAL